MKILFILLVSLFSNYGFTQSIENFTSHEGFVRIFPKITYKKDSIYTFTDVYPTFKGGVDSLAFYITSNLNTEYVHDYFKTIYVEFIITKNGDLINSKIMKGDNPNMNNEALRVVNSMPKWNPALVDNKFVSCYYTLPIKSHYR